MPVTTAAVADAITPADLISFLKAIPDGRSRHGVRYPQCFLLLVAVLGILSGCRSSRDLEAFAKRHREALNQATPWLPDTSARPVATERVSLN